jgi:hypothetical protein
MRLTSNDTTPSTSLKPPIKTYQQLYQPPSLPLNHHTRTNEPSIADVHAPHVIPSTAIVVCAILGSTISTSTNGIPSPPSPALSSENMALVSANVLRYATNALAEGTSALVPGLRGDYRCVVKEKGARRAVVLIKGSCGVLFVRAAG